MTGHVSRLQAPDLPEAACVTFDPELWFAEDTQYPVKANVEWARQVCMSCAERVKCLMWGLQGEEYGMFGGLTANERELFKARELDKLKHLAELGLI
jgi:WhiB family transcriptional regulator, redox-sensing transcriptional regulator